MALAQVQSKFFEDLDVSTNCKVTFTSNVTAGNLIVVAVTHATTNTTTDLIDNLGNDYIEIDQLAGNGGNRNLSTWYVKNILGGACTITAQFSGGFTANFCIGATEVSGAGISTPLNQNTIQELAAGTGTDAVTSGNVVTTQDGCLIFCGAYDMSSNTAVAGTGFTRRATGIRGLVGIEDRIQATAGSVAGTWTDAVGGNWVVAMAAFGADAAPAYSGPKLILVPPGH